MSLAKFRYHKPEMMMIINHDKKCKNIIKIIIDLDSEQKVI